MKKRTTRLEMTFPQKRSSFNFKSKTKKKTSDEESDYSSYPFFPRKDFLLIFSYQQYLIAFGNFYLALSIPTTT